MSTVPASFVNNSPAQASSTVYGSAELHSPGQASDQRLDRIRSRLTSEVGPQRFERYFDKQARLTVTPEGLDVTVPSRFMADLLDRRFGAAIRAAIRAEWSEQTAQESARDGSSEEQQGSPQPSGTEAAVDADSKLHYRVDTRAFASVPRERNTLEQGRGSGNGSDPSPNAAPSPAAQPFTTSRPTPAAGPAKVSSNAHALARYRLETFVVGLSNRLAYSAAVKIAESADAREFTRLFIQGRCGMGKTHLLHGIVARFRELHPSAVTRYTTAEDFTNEYITAVRNNRIDAFRKQYRRVDLLCLDDVHFLSKKDKTQSELQHTFDAIDLDGARLVLASDEHPRAIAHLSEHLVSRFLAGAVVRLEVPDRALRAQLVRAIAARRGLKIDDDAVASFVAHTAAHGSARDIEGAVMQLEATMRFSPGQSASGILDAGLVRRAFGSNVTSVRSGRPVSFPAVIAEVCRELSVEPSAFHGTGRHPRVVLARCICGHLGRSLTTLSFPEIARHMSRPTHSTIISGCRRLKLRLEDPVLSSNDLKDEFGQELGGLTLPELVARITTSVMQISART